MKKNYVTSDLIGWIMGYLIIGVFLMNYSILLLCFSTVYWMIFGFIIARNVEKDQEPSENGHTEELYNIKLEGGTDIYIPYSTKRSIEIMLNYYTPNETIRWSMRTYHWKEVHAKNVVDNLVIKLFNSKK